MIKNDLNEINVANKRVLVRVDFNVPLDAKTGSILDDTRIKAAIPTIKYLADHQARIILCSHLGRPEGKVVESLRMEPIANRLSELLALPVFFAKDCIGDTVKRQVDALKNGEILLLENLRFRPEEESNDSEFAKQLADQADLYVDDAFGTAHRAHASTVGVADYLPAYAGFLMRKEIDALGRLMSKPEKPFAALLGGAKVSDKIGLIENILTKVDLILLGGGMAATFLKVSGFNVGLSKIELNKLEMAESLMQKATTNGVSFLLPNDVVVAESINEESARVIVPISSIGSKQLIVDIGTQTIDLFSKALIRCKTIFWNGPMGIYEISQFSEGTKAMAKVLVETKATTIVGGGSTAEIVEEMGLAGKMTHVSTGGGASLEFLEGKILPGIKVLADNKI